MSTLSDINGMTAVTCNPRGRDFIEDRSVLVYAMQCAVAARKANVASRSREVILPLCSDLVGLPCPGLGSPVQERRGPTGVSPAKGYTDDEGTGASDI